VAIIRNEQGVELNLVFNANAGDPAANILMDVPEKHPGYTHIALRVTAIPATIATLKANNIAIAQGPVSFGDAGQVSVFVRDPDGGTLRVGGRIVSEPRRSLPPERRNMSMIFQSYALWPHMTIADNVGYGLRVRRVERAERERRVAAILDVAHLTELAQRYPH